MNRLSEAEREGLIEAVQAGTEVEYVEAIVAARLASVALADNVRAMLRFLTPNDITPVGRRQIERVLDEHTRRVIPPEGGAVS